MIKILHYIKFGLLRRINTNLYNKHVQKQLYAEELQKLKTLKSEEDLALLSPPSIKVVNLNANDVCNSKCVMCRIWAQEKQHEITPDELYNILTDPLFKNVSHIGVTGGEPTLREDLPLLYDAIFRALPNIEGVSTITNCIDQENVIKRIEMVIDICKKYNKPFSFMISLDGVGKIHESVRRIKGNFDSAIAVYNHFQDKVNVATGTTISKINVWYVDDLLFFMKKNKIYGRFRVAEYIKRLYNDSVSSIIRNFDKDETYHLILFFYKLIYTFESNPEFIRTYKSIINILEGGRRLIGCPYQNNGVVLNSRGELSYCAPKSEIIGNAIERSAINLYNTNLNEKERILKENCSNCIHDYHAPITYKEADAMFKEKETSSFFKLDNILSIKDFNFTHIIAPPIETFTVLITGWYGTETVGDKAILAQIIKDIQEKHGDNTKVIISAIYPFVVKRTIEELNLKNTTCIKAFSDDFIRVAKQADITIMGGGPLMDLPELSLPLLAFGIAKQHKKQTIVYGCGIGPLNNYQYSEAVKKILSLADIIMLRDRKSVEIAKLWCKNPNIILSGDPAQKYVESFKISKQKKSKDSRIIIRCFLREWTHEYSKNNLSHEDFKIIKTEFERNIANYIIKSIEKYNADEVIFESMHTFIVGGDDRDFARYFIAEYLQNLSCKILFNRKLSTIESITNSMQNSCLNICMRFHSVLFANTLETNFVAIDYTLGGKIFNYLKDNNKLNKLIEF